MAKKSSTGAGVLLVIGGVIATIGAAIEWAKSNMLMVGLVIVLALLAVVLIKYNAAKVKKARLQELVHRFGNEEIARDIMNGRFWTGQSAEQLIESLGPAHAIDKQVLKTKKKETWKYSEIRRNQFALRITLENDVVVGWDKKST